MTDRRVAWVTGGATGIGLATAELLAEPTIPAGHTEGFHDAFARLHRAFEADVRKWKAGEKFSCDGSQYANIEDGWTGIAFIETTVKSAASNGKWTKLPKNIN